MRQKSVLASLAAAGFLVIAALSASGKELKEADVPFMTDAIRTYQNAETFKDYVDAVAPRLRPSAEKFYRAKAAEFGTMKMPTLLVLGKGRFALKAENSLIAYEVLDLSDDKFLINNKPVLFASGDTGEAVFKKIAEVLPTITASKSVMRYFVPPAEAQDFAITQHISAVLSVYKDSAKAAQDCWQIAQRWRECDHKVKLFTDKKMQQEFISPKAADGDEGKGDPNTMCGESVDLMNFVKMKNKEYKTKDKVTQTNKGENTKPQVDGMQCHPAGDSKEDKKAKKGKFEPLSKLAKAEKALDKKENPEAEKSKEAATISFQNVDECATKLRGLIEGDTKKDQTDENGKKKTPFLTKTCQLPKLGEDEPDAKTPANSKQPVSKPGPAVK